MACRRRSCRGLCRNGPVSYGRGGSQTLASRKLVTLGLNRLAPDSAVGFQPTAACFEAKELSLRGTSVCPPGVPCRYGWWNIPIPLRVVFFIIMVRSPSA